MEILYAYEQGTPVVVWTRWNLDGEPLTRTELSPWMIHHADEIVSSPIDAIAILQEVA